MEANNQELNKNEVFLKVEEKEKYGNISNLPNEENTDEFKFTKYTLIRTILTSLGITVVVLNSIYGFMLPHGDIECLQDKSFIFTQDFNKYLQDHVLARHIIIAFSSFCVDFVIVYMSIYWCMYAKSWRLMATIGVFYGFRGSIQNIFQMKYPEGYLWEYPGFPSLTISYLKTNDFFFSGHVGFPIIIAMECYKLNKKYMVTFCLFTCLFEAFTMIVTRGHYFIDIITGMIVSHYVYLLVDKYIYLIDDSFIGMSKEEEGPGEFYKKEEGFKNVEIKGNDEIKV
jgi:hypothetical protein